VRRKSYEFERNKLAEFCWSGVVKIAQTTHGTCGAFCFLPAKPLSIRLPGCRISWPSTRDGGGLKPLSQPEPARVGTPPTGPRKARVGLLRPVSACVTLGGLWPEGWVACPVTPRPFLWRVAVMVVRCMGRWRKAKKRHPDHRVRHDGCDTTDRRGGPGGSRRSASNTGSDGRGAMGTGVRDAPPQGWGEGPGAGPAAGARVEGPIRKKK